jgi:uncharacterized protein (DUF433 family)
MTDMLRVTEAAVVSGVGVREVNRAVDEGILSGAFSAGESRRFSAGACVAISFYFGSATRLTVEERLFAIDSIEPRLRRSEINLLEASASEDWTVRDGFLTIDMAPFLTATFERLRRLEAARALVTSAPDVLSGTPVIAGTRIPVHDVAASIAVGHTREEVLAAYPSLTAEQIELATLYAEANPLRGRPRLAPLPRGATLLADRRIARAGKAE